MSLITHSKQVAKVARLADAPKTREIFAVQTWEETHRNSLIDKHQAKSKHTQERDTCHET